ncbi:hypothetical protein [Legionella sp. km772]|uniref:hypothetical protein n=1 Tax=Legionella sp. km772 TaxID=2498111 RepID=UPI000F8D0C90|nr:hypothetical protein [Legionella sp. km772]RUR11646.1 hypothetical protein ELY15_06890 [Legionella sp. km772]
MNKIKDLEASLPNDFADKKAWLLEKGHLIAEANLSTIKGKPLTKQALSLVVLNSIPFLSGFLRSVDSTGAALSKLAQLKGSTIAHSTAQGFGIGGIVLSAVDFIRIPLICGASCCLGLEPPITPTNFARWLYSGVILALGITAMAVPGTAPIIALVSAGLGLALAVCTLGKHFYDRYQYKKSLALTQREIEEKMGLLEGLQAKAQELITLVKEATPSELAQLETELLKLNSDFKKEAKQLQTLKTEELQTEQKLKKLGWSAGLGKGVAIGLASMAMLGVILTPFFPPVGLSIIAASAAAGGLFALGTVAVTVLTKVFKSKHKAEDKVASSSINYDPNDTVSLKASLNLNSINSSTYCITKALGGKEKQEKNVSEKLSSIDELGGKIVKSLPTMICTNNFPDEEQSEYTATSLVKCG